MAAVPCHSAGDQDLRQGRGVGAIAVRAASGLGVQALDSSTGPDGAISGGTPLIGFRRFSYLLRAEHPSTALAEEPHRFALGIRGHQLGDLPAITVWAVRGLGTQADLLGSCRPQMDLQSRRTNSRMPCPKGRCSVYWELGTSGREEGPAEGPLGTLATVRQRSNQDEP